MSMVPWPRNVISAAKTSITIAPQLRLHVTGRLSTHATGPLPTQALSCYLIWPEWLRWPINIAFILGGVNIYIGSNKAADLLIATAGLLGRQISMSILSRKISTPTTAVWSGENDGGTNGTERRMKVVFAAVKLNVFWENFEKWYDSPKRLSFNIIRVHTVPGTLYVL
jgi:hypothetical protein